MGDFLASSLTREGAESMITPREIIRDFVTLLDLLYTNPDKSFSDLVGLLPKTEAPAEDDAPAESAPAPGKSVTMADLEF